MKSTSLLAALSATALTFFFSVKPVPPTNAQTPTTIPVVDKHVTDSLERVLAEKSKSTLSKAGQLVNVSKVVKEQSEEISRKKRRVVVKRVVVPVAVPVCCDSMTTTYQQPVTPRHRFLWRVFHPRKKD